MRVSIDERDITTIFDFEYYLKERNNKIYLTEYERLKEKAELLKVIKINEQMIKDEKKVSFLFLWYTKEFYCQASILKEDEPPRFRKMVKNAEEITSIVSYYTYLKERNFLLNTREYLNIMNALNRLDQYHVEEWRIEDIVWQSPSIRDQYVYSKCGIEILNQLSGNYSVFFKKKDRCVKVETDIMRYNMLAKERRREPYV